MSEYALHGDGINDDTQAIQNLLDSGVCEVVLPVPEKEYVISKTLKIHEGQTLRLPRFAKIRLAADSNCCMLEDDDFSTWKENVCIDGGIWDMNNGQQEPNPYHFPGKDGKTFYTRMGTNFPFAGFTQFPDTYTGFAMRFCRVKRLILKNLTFKNPVTYGVQLGYVEDFTISDILFDYTQGAPKLWNMDGIHVEGNCKNGVITNLKGACHDDLVAITADDGLYGPIENIVVDGIFAEHSHSAVRLLSHGVPVKNITIRNVFGSYYVYCIGLTKYHGGEEERGIMENITIENVTACASEGTKDVWGGNYPFIWVQKGLDVKNLRIINVAREEKTYPTSTIQVDEGATVNGFTVSDVLLTNKLNAPVKLLDLQGEIINFTHSNVKEE